MNRYMGLALILMVLGGAIGFELGHRTAAGAGAPSRSSASRDSHHGNIPGKSDEGSQGGTRREGTGSAVRPRAGDSAARRDTSPQATVRQVVSALESDPMGDVDFDAMCEAYEAVRWMSTAETQAALTELSEVETTRSIRSLLEMVLVNHWSKEDGYGLLQFALGQTQPGLKSSATTKGLRGWAEVDPEAAYAWYRNNQDKLTAGAAGSYMEGSLLACLAVHDMEGAFARLGELEADSRQRALGTMAGQLARDPARRNTLLEALDRLEDAEERNKAVEYVVSTWSWQDPEGAAAFVDGRTFEAERRTRLMERVARSWAQSKPEEALAWRLGTAQDGDEDKGEVISTPFTSWLTQDPAAAEDWLANQPAEVRTDTLYRTASERLTQFRDFRRAASYAGRIEEDTSRLARMRDLYVNWNKANEEEAAAWLAQLDETTRSAVVEEESGSAPED